MSAGEVLALLAAGVAAGTINTVVGSGTLLTFPVLLALGYSPLAANVANTIGLAPGALSGAYGYRRELRGQRSRAIRLGAYSLGGAIVGAVVLLVAPASAFEAVVPWLVGLAVLLVALGPYLGRAVAARRRGAPTVDGGNPLRLAMFSTGIYGGYFGAAQGVLLTAALGIGLDEELQRVNALKNLLAGLVNGVAAVLFIVVADVEWAPALLLAVGSITGGQLGARVGRRLPPPALRAVIVAVGLAALVSLLV